MYRSIGAILFYNKHGQLKKGTGFLVSEDTVVTAAHLLYSIYDEYHHTGIRFYPGLHGNTNDHKHYVPESKEGKETIYIPNEYIKGDKG